MARKSPIVVFSKALRDGRLIEVVQSPVGDYSLFLDGGEIAGGWPSARQGEAVAYATGFAYAADWFRVLYTDRKE